MKIVERIPAHYEVQEVGDFGRSYRWCPEQLVLECSECGTKLTLNRSEVISSEVISCECGKDDTAHIREELVIQVVDEEYEAHHHPWDHDAKAQAKQHLRNEAVYPKGSAWRYNDVTARNGIEE